MSRPVLPLLLGALLCCLAGPLAAATPAPATVNILIWEEFLADKVVKTLKNRDGLVVNQVTFTSAEERDALLKKHNGSIDLMVVDTTALGNFRRRGVLEQIDGNRIPNLKHVLARWQTDMSHAVPYLWGHTGIAWRTDLVKTPLATYADLFALAQQQPGKVSLLDDTHEALRAALYAFGKAPWEMKNAAQVKAADGLLRPRLGNVRIVGSELDENAPLVTGDIIAAQAYNGDIAYLRDTYKVPLGFAVPSPGCMIWQENFVLLRASKNKDAAYRFLNAINNSALAARNAVEVRYATSNALAVQLLEPSFRDDPIIRPTLDGLDHCYFYPVFDAATQQALDNVDLAAP